MFKLLVISIILLMHVSASSAQDKSYFCKYSLIPYMGLGANTSTQGRDGAIISDTTSNLTTIEENDVYQSIGHGTLKYGLSFVTQPFSRNVSIGTRVQYFNRLYSYHVSQSDPFYEEFINKYNHDLFVETNNVEFGLSLAAQIPFSNSYKYTVLPRIEGLYCASISSNILMDLGSDDGSYSFSGSTVTKSTGISLGTMFVLNKLIIDICYDMTDALISIYDFKTEKWSSYDIFSVSIGYKINLFSKDVE